MGSFKFVYLGILIISTLLIFGLSLSPNKTPSLSFYRNFLYFVWIIFIGEWVIHALTGFSFLPLGSYDPDTYLLQKFGYATAFIVFIISSILLGIFFGSNIMKTGQVWLPAPSLLTGPKFQTISTTAYDFWSGTKTSRALADSLPPTIVENNLIIYLPIIFLWLIPRFILERFGVDPLFATLIGFLIWVFAIGGVFSFIYHPFAYQGVQPAYWRAYGFTLLCGIPTGLTGFPACDVPHFVNNWVASSEGLISKPKAVLIQVPVE